MCLFLRMILVVQLETCRRRRQKLKKMLKIVQEKIRIKIQDEQKSLRKSKDELAPDDSGNEVSTSRKQMSVSDEQEGGERARKVLELQNMVQNFVTLNRLGWPRS